MTHIARDDAITLLKKYNQDPFHIQHALTVEAVMKWYAKELGYGDDAEYWGIVGLLHDIDFELYPDEHCIKAPELLREGGVGEDIIHAVCSHGYGITVGCGKTIDVEPVHEMEKVLFAADELTGLVWASPLILILPAIHGKASPQTVHLPIVQIFILFIPYDILKYRCVS